MRRSFFCLFSVFDLEGSPSRPGSRQPLVARLVNGAAPGTPLYPVLPKPVPTAHGKPPKAKTPDDVVVDIPTEKPRGLAEEKPLSIPIITDILSADPGIEITVDPPEYNHAPSIPLEAEQPPAYNSQPMEPPIIEIATEPIILMETEKPVLSEELLTSSEPEITVLDELDFEDVTKPVDDDKVGGTTSDPLPTIPVVIQEDDTKSSGAEQEGEPTENMDEEPLLDAVQPLASEPETADVINSESPTLELETPSPILELATPAIPDLSLNNIEPLVEVTDTNLSEEPDSVIDNTSSTFDLKFPTSTETTDIAEQPDVHLSTPLPVVLDSEELDEELDTKETPSAPSPDDLIALEPEETSERLESGLDTRSSMPSSLDPVNIQDPTNGTLPIDPDVEKDSASEPSQQLTTTHEPDSQDDENDSAPEETPELTVIMPTEGDESLKIGQPPNNDILSEDVSATPTISALSRPETPTQGDIPDIITEVSETTEPSIELLPQPETTNLSTSDPLSKEDESPLPVEELDLSNAESPPPISNITDATSTPSTPEPLLTIAPEDMPTPKEDQEFLELPEVDQPSTSNDAIETANSQSSGAPQALSPETKEAPEGIDVTPQDVSSEQRGSPTCDLEAPRSPDFTSPEVEAEVPTSEMPNEPEISSIEPSIEDKLEDELELKSETIEPTGLTPLPDVNLPNDLHPAPPAEDDSVDFQPTEEAMSQEPLSQPDDDLPDLIYPTQVAPSPQPSAQPMPIDLPLPSIPETDEATDLLQGDMSDSIVESIELASNEGLDISHPDSDGKNNSIKPTETPPPPYSTLPRSFESEQASPKSSSPTSDSPPDDDNVAVLLAENAVLAESPLPAEASAPVVASPHHTPPPASPANGVDQPASKPPLPPGEAKPSKE